jgi:urea transporter
MAQLPALLKVITPALVTEQAVLVDEYVTGVAVLVAVAAGTGGVEPNAVFGSAGNVIASAPTGNDVGPAVDGLYGPPAVGVKIAVTLFAPQLSAVVVRLAVPPTPTVTGVPIAVPLS